MNDEDLTSQEPITASSLHPLSLVFELAHRIRANLLPAIFASFSAATGGIVGLYIGLGIFGVAIAIAIVRYMTFRYRLTSEHLLVDQGLVFRTHRSVPIDRIQNIDSVQNLFHRLFKVAEVRVETASGNEPEATMRVISVAEVERLRTRVRALTAARLETATDELPASDAIASHAEVEAHSETEPPEPAPPRLVAGSVADETTETVLTIPVRQLIQAGLISNRGQVLAGLVLGYFWQAYVRGPKLSGAEDADGSAVRSWVRDAVKETVREASHATEQFDWLGTMGSYILTASLIALAVLLIIAVLRLFSVAWFVMKFYDYRLTRRGRDFHIQCGLFTKVSASLPADRIQVICVHRTWLARLLGLAAIRVEASGGSGKEEEDASATVARQWFVPVMRDEDVPRVLQTLQPGMAVDLQSLDWKPLAPRAYARMIRMPLVIFGILVFASIIVGTTLDWSYATLPCVVGIVGMLTTVLLAKKRAKSRKYARHDHGFIYRSGVLVHKTSYGFWDRTQSISLSESPFDRRWGMAAIFLDTAAAGTADHTLAIEYLASDVAREEFNHAVLALEQTTA